MNVVRRAQHGFGGFMRRNASAIPLAIIGLCILAMFYLQALTIGKLGDEVNRQSAALEQTKEIAKDIQSNSEERNRQIDDLNRHLDCIVQFFTHPDRNGRAIDNIDTCRISDTKPAETSLAPHSVPPSTPPTQTAHPQETPVSPPPATTRGKSTPPSKSNGGNPVPKGGLLQQLLGWIGL